MSGHAPGVIREHAPAKLNLYLEVTGRRADGYHLLESLVGFADIGDLIEIAPAAAFSLAIDGPFAAAFAHEVPENNLVSRAAQAMAKAAGRAPDVAIRLHKALPVASGIGGGSADAAAALRGLARLWGIDARDARLLAIARTLGQDVPVCLAGRPAFFRGIGDEIEILTVPLPGLDVLLVNPGVALATPAVFKARSGPFSMSRPFGPPPHDPAGLLTRLHERSNDLTVPAQRLVPEIGSVLAALAGAPGCGLARMSGSGATCFGLFASATEAADAARAMAAARPSWWVAQGHIRA